MGWDDTNAGQAKLPCHEQIISESRAVQEALARLGPGATAADVQRLLAQEGMKFSVACIERVLADEAGRDTPRPSDLVLTEGEQVPPPEDLPG
jgi:hypothetical protein